ncbi:MAG: N-6 DNA methylase [Nitrospirae bacterium]|nr:N-6 DNA methylase [Nitrospirota bacterium]
MNIKEIVSSANKLPYKELCTALIDRFAVQQPVKWESVLPYAEQHSLFGGEILRLISDHPTLANQKEIRPVCVMRGELSQLLFFYIQLKDEKLSRTIIERISRKFVGGAAADRYIIWFFGNNNADALKIVISGKEVKKIRLKTLTLEAGHWFKTYDYILGEIERRFTPPSPPPLIRGGDRGGDFKEPSGLYKAVWEAFDISIVNKRFYAEIKGVFDALTKEELPKCKGVLTDEKERVQFAIRLIGRIIFCWFLKRKDIISEDVLSSKAVQSTPNYYHSLLEPLFFDVLNTPRNERRKELPDLIKDYPFLNGGLFEPQRQDCKDNWSLYIPNDWFDGFFSNTLEKYNFTVDENTAASAEIAIDPEMLGRIFENLLAEQNPETGESARKATGSYYTPREIVDFMVEESLIAYLKDNSENIKIIPSPLAGEGKGEGEFNNAVEDFVHTAELPDALKPHSKELLEKLNTVKVLDPACGSGAFPISMLQKLVALKQQLSSDVGDNKLYDIKLKTIENSIYGVDIQPMATELSRLRCWLSLIVDEDTKEIKPLPNLDFKFVTANSLIDLGYDEFIHKVETGAIGRLFLTNFINKLNELRLVRQKYFYTVANEKENNPPIPPLVKGSKVFIPSPLTGVGKGGGEVRGFSSEKDKLKKEFNTIKDALFKMSMELITHGFIDLEFANKINKWNPFDDSEAAPFFSSEWMFGIPSPSHFVKGAPLTIPSPLAGEGRGKGGFDIVIGNPPYGAYIDNETIKQLVKLYSYYDRQKNSASFFIEVASRLIKKNAVVTYIVPKSLSFSEGWNKTRQLISSTNTLHIVIDASKAFENVLLEAIIISFINKKSNNYFFSCGESWGNAINVTGISNSDIIKELDILPVYITSERLHILRKSAQSSVLLSSISITSRGLPLQSKISQKGDPILRGKNIGKYRIYGEVDRVSLLPDILQSKKVKEITQRKIVSQNIVAHVLNPYDHIIIMSSLDTEGTLSLDTVMNTVLTTEQFAYEYILALLNSQFASWFYYWFVYNRAVRTMHFDKYYLGKLPIKKIDLSSQQPFITLVDQILAAKQQPPFIPPLIRGKEDCYLFAKGGNKEADTSALEQQIDEMVYKLYDLTPEEIAIVEGRG